MTFAQLNNNQRDYFLKHGVILRRFSTDRQGVLDLLDSLRDERVFYTVRESDFEVGEEAGLVLVSFYATLGDVMVESRPAANVG